MDPVCHTLTGTALGFTGLEKRARFSRATLIIGANLPDIDAVTYFFDGVDHLAVRRGITHGIPALLVLPLLLALAMKGVAALKAAPPGRPEASLRQLWLLSAVAIATHPLLDYLNNYGMRWLMPFVDRWVYGDTLYIIDPLMWAILLTGIAAGILVRHNRLQSWRQPATIALGVAVLYILLNGAGTLVARQAAFAALHDVPPARIMASPVPKQPLQRRLLLEYANEYRFGRVDLLPRPLVTLESSRIPKGSTRDLALAASTRDGGIFLRWARFPFSESRLANGELVIRVMDARYVREWQDSFAAISVTVPAPESSSGLPSGLLGVDPAVDLRVQHAERHGTVD